MCAPLFHVKTPQMKLVQKLAAESIISSSQLSIKGQWGSGKTHVVRMLQRKSKPSEDGAPASFPWRVHRYSCLCGSDPKALFVNLIGRIKSDEVIVANSLPRLVHQFAEVLIAGGAGLLYLDNAHRLSASDKENIQEAVQVVREEQPFGLVMTSLCDQPQFDDILLDPTSLADVQLKQLTQAENLRAMKSYDSRFAPWVEGFDAQEPAARELAQAIHEHTLGNFERLASLCRSIAHHIKGDKLEAQQVTTIIAGRGR